MKDVFVISDNIISSLGFTTAENIENIKAGKSGIQFHDNKNLSNTPLHASLTDNKRLEDLFSLNTSEKFSRLEKMLILSISDALKESSIDIKSERTLLIFSTTKGNIDLLESDENDSGEKRLKLWEMGNIIQQYFGNPNKPIVVSNACISGVIAITAAKRLLQSGIYDNAVIVGGDILSEFIVSGFQSFKSLSSAACKPYDLARDGLSLGEGCGTIILSCKNTSTDEAIKVSGGASSNDANHISGPSRDGEGLYIAISRALKNISSSEIDYISAHGTATSYNDEMESHAITKAGLSDVPMNSLKSYFGHTLGAAGIIESIVAINSMRKNIVFKTAGFENFGLTNQINIISENKEFEIKNCLKFASGFGGCNAAVVFSKFSI